MKPSEIKAKIAMAKEQHTTMFGEPICGGGDEHTIENSACLSHDLAGELKKRTQCRDCPAELKLLCPRCDAGKPCQYCDDEVSNWAELLALRERVRELEGAGEKTDSESVNFPDEYFT